MRTGYELRFKEGDIVCWCHSDGNAKYSVHYGRVDTQFSDVVVVDYLAQRERRLIDGVPIEEFESEDKYRKLPKGWSYDTQLFEISYRDFPEYDGVSISIKDPSAIKDAYERGMLVKDSTIFHGTIETDITKEGFRVIKKYPMWQHHIDHASILPTKLYLTYDEARKEVDANIAEFMRQAALSDYDWSVEKIDKTLGFWKYMSDATDNEVKTYRDWLLARDKVEDIEVRLFGGNIQWKYCKNKKWMNIEI